MKKRAAKFICLLLAVCVWMPTAVFADDAETLQNEIIQSEPEDGQTAEDDILQDLDDLFDQATSTPEPTPVPSATPDPSAAFENDAYYNEAMGLLQALSVFTGYEDNTMRPGATITRAEMATVILNMMNVKDYMSYAGVFSDVSASDWHANIIQTAVDMQIVSGMGDGTFAPDSPVTYVQAVKMIVCALGYGEYALYRGGWPNGYLTTASRINLNKNASGASDEPVQRGVVAKLVYNAMMTDYPQFNGFSTDENGQQAPVYKTVSGETLGFIKYDLRKIEGIIEVTSAASMVYAELLPQGKVQIDGQVYNDTSGALDSLIGHRAALYYTTDEVGTNTVIYAAEASKNSTFVINAENFGKFNLSSNIVTGITYYPEGKGKSSRTLSKFDAPVIIYNSQYLSESDTVGTSYEEFITPQNGKVTLVDNDNDGSYEVINIEKYETMTVAAATDKRITGRINGVDNVIIDVDTSGSDERIVKVIKAGAEVRPRNLNENDVASIKRSATSVGTEVIEIQVSGETVSGAVSGIETDESNNYVALINGERYIVDANAIDDISLNSQATFGLDIFGRIGYASSSLGTSANEKYGWIMKVYEDENNPGSTMMRIYTEDGVKELALASKVNYWGPSAASASSVDGANLDFFSNIEYADAGDYEIRLCKFATNSSGEIRKLYIANSDTDLADSGAVTFDNNPIVNATSSGNLAGGYLMNSGNTIEIMFPSNIDNYGDSSLYSYSVANSSNYLSNDGNGITFIAAEIDDRTPMMVLRVNEYSSSSPNKDVGETGYTSADHATFMLTKITATINSDNDPIFILTGYSNGSEVKLTTGTVTAVYTLSDSGAVFADRCYTLGNNGNSIWNAIDNDPEEIYDAISPGDVFTYSLNGSEVVCLTKLVDVNYLIENRKNLFNSDNRASETRDQVMFGPVTETYFGTEAILESDSWSTSFESSKLMDACIIKVDDSGKATSADPTFSRDDAYDIYELMKYEDYGDSLGEGDFVFVRKFKGGMREIYVWRFTTDV